MSLQFLRNTYHLKTAILMSRVMSAGFHSLKHPDFASWCRDHLMEGMEACCHPPLCRDPGLCYLGRCIISSIRILLSSTKILKPSVPFHRGLLLFSLSVLSEFLWPHGLQHPRSPCPSLSPRIYSNTCPLSRWCHPTISSSVVPFSSCPQSFPASGLSQWLGSSHQVAKLLEFQLQHQFFQWIFRVYFL